MNLLDKILISAVCVAAATVAVMYFTGKLSISCDIKKKNFANLNTACQYLAESVSGTPDADQINQLCAQYQGICGNASTTAEILSLSNMDPSDPDHALMNALQQDVLEVKLDTAKCQPLLKCNEQKGVGCPSFLKCENKVCN